MVGCFYASSIFDNRNSDTATTGLVALCWPGPLTLSGSYVQTTTTSTHEQACVYLMRYMLRALHLQGTCEVSDTVGQCMAVLFARPTDSNESSDSHSFHCKLASMQTPTNLQELTDLRTWQTTKQIIEVGAERIRALQ